MKRDIIIIEDKAVSVTGNEVWMTATEIAGLLLSRLSSVLRRQTVAAFQ